jgi:FkbH-like protein
VKDLQRTGVLLAVASKNDADLVASVFNDHRDMVLRSHDFVTLKVNWTNKAANLQAIAEELDLAPESFVFIDDNAVERALIKQAMPEVAVPEFPDRPELLPNWFVTDVVPAYFPRVRVLESDAAKSKQYRARGERHRAATIDLEGFLASLDMSLTFRVDDPDVVNRLSQMTQKTNQFNLTTQRWSPSEVAARTSDPGIAVIACDYSDRFGDEGTVGMAVLDVKEGALVNLLLSCRVLGRGVEDRLMEYVEVLACRHGLGELTATFVPTDRNRVARPFLERRGYVEMSSSDACWMGQREIGRGNQSS